MRIRVLLGCLAFLMSEAFIPAADSPPKQAQEELAGARAVRLFRQFDKNRDGRLVPAECSPPLQERFQQFDANKDGGLSLQELRQGMERVARKGPARLGGRRWPDSVKVGDAAPDFTLTDPSRTKQVTLSSFRGKKPVVLIFGSCT